MSYRSIDLPHVSALFESYHQQIYRYALSLMHDPAEADDVVQETFLRAYQRLDSLRDSGALIAWLYRIATRPHWGSGRFGHRCCQGDR